MSGERRHAVVLGGGALGQAVADALGGKGFESRAAERVPGDPGPIDLAVLVMPGDTAPRPLASLAEESWIALGEAPLAEARAHFAALSARMRSPGGTVLVVLSHAGMVGVAGLAAHSMAAGGIRSFAKAVARAWRPRGLRVNSAILSVAQIGDAEAGLAREIAGLAAATAGEGFRATGNSILIDGEQTSV